MYFDNIPTVPTAEELLDRSFRRAAKKMQEKSGSKSRADEEFVRAITQATHDKLVSIIQSFPEFEQLPPFYRDLCDILFGMDNLRKALGMVGWAAKNVRDVGKSISRGMRRADSLTERRRAVARIASIVHRSDEALRYLNDVRNVLRKLPVISADEFTIVVAGYPNVGKSSFIRLVSTAEPEIASYPFTTKGVIVGHRNAERRRRIQFIDTPGLLDRTDEERNVIEKQALNALVYVADLVLFVIDASEHCGYSVEAQEKLHDEIAGIVSVPMITVVNKSDLKKTEGRFNMSTVSGEGVEEVLAELLRLRGELMHDEIVDIRSELPMPEMKRRGGRSEMKTDY
ncbi:NOG1 family protein [Methanorbis rubei]|uniref:GTPase Obg n=1 Tax=Methanorbis rubei TaxID=3028300 RepID=A0AAE4MGB3_9EURY|nr:GTPase Obg [Methanocorpusculaceae archaeon Cs1]